MKGKLCPFRLRTNHHEDESLAFQTYTQAEIRILLTNHIKHLLQELNDDIIGSIYNDGYKTLEDEN